MPSVVRTDIDSNSAQIAVTITAEEIKPKVDAELKRFRQRAGIKGFRQGQAPMPYIKKMYGSSILVDTFNDMMSHEVYEYLKQSQLDVLGQPLPAENQQRYNFKIDQIDPEYTVVYEVGFVSPFELAGLDKDQKFERLTVDDLEKLADDDLDYARNRMGARTNPENDIEENDIVRIQAKEVGGDYETTISVFGKNIVDEKFKKDLLSKKKGDTIQFNARHVEEQKSEEMYRKYILSLPDNDDRPVGDLFDGVIEEVSRVEKAELNEEFYHNYFGPQVNTLEEAREQIKKGILGFYEVRSSALLMREFQERLMSLNKIPLPDTFLKRWLLVSNEGNLTAQQVEAEYEAFAENLRWTLIRDKIKEQFNVEVTDAELHADYARRVRNYFQVDLPDNIIESSVERLMKDQKEVDETRRNLETDKLFEAIRTQVTITDKAIPSKEFHQILDAITKKTDQPAPDDLEVEASIVE